MHLASPADPEVPRRFEAYCSENTSIPNKKEQRRKQARTDVPPQTETLYHHLIVALSPQPLPFVIAVPKQNT